MLSTLPKLADRAFILGFFLPSLLFALAVLSLLIHHTPARTVLGKLTDEKNLGTAAFLLVAVWCIGVLMLVINLPLYRLLEGYSWPVSRRKRWREGYIAEWRKLENALDDFAKQWKREGDRFPNAAIEQYTRLKQEAVRRFPSAEADVMPTAFGNAIRAFEVYPRDVYGADGVPMWLRLSSVIPKPLLEATQDARSQIDFLVNCSFFGAVVAVIAIGDFVGDAAWRIVVSPPLAGWSDVIRGLRWVSLGSSLVASVLAVGFYRWSVSRIPAWGDLVMAAFDCGLPALAAQLGFELPPTAQQREKFWREFSQMLVYRRDRDGDLPFRPEEWPQLASRGKPAKGQEAAPQEQKDSVPDC